MSRCVLCDIEAWEVRELMQRQRSDTTSTPASAPAIPNTVVRRPTSPPGAASHSVPLRI